MRDFANAPPELVPLRLGHCRSYEAASRRGAPWRKVDFPAGAALILHPLHGAILFDTGYGRAFWEATTRFPERLYRWATPATLEDGDRLPRQLARLGIDELSLVIFSHLHADHVAGYFDLAPSPPVLTSRAAMDGLDQGGRLATLKAGCPETLRRRLQALGPQILETCPPPARTPEGFAAFGPLHDLFGDGSMIGVPLPGHGIGQFGLYLPETTEGAQFLIADAAWSLQALREMAPPPRATLARLGDEMKYMKTFTKLCELMRARPDMRILPSHCPETFPDRLRQPIRA